MTRIFSDTSGDTPPSLDPERVAAFFRERAGKAQQVGYVQSVIYQDKNPQLAQERDAHEKELLLPLLRLCPTDSVLDVGCGTGRWADVVVPQCGSYIGTDFCAELLSIAKDRFTAVPNVRFLCLPAESISIAQINRRCDVILSLGLFLYLSDEAMARALQGYAEVAAGSCRLLVREPVATGQRMTLVEHYSEDMEQIYNAVYRTESEVISGLDQNLCPHGFTIRQSGDVFPASLNNRVETKQKWFLLER